MDIDSDAYSPSPGTSSEPARVPDDYSTVRNPGAGAKTWPQVSAESPIDVDDSDLDVTISNLPEKLGFSKEFQDELEKVGGSSQSLAVRLLESHDTETLGFKAGQLCATPEQLKFYTKTLDSGPMVTRWLTSGYEIPFSKVPTAPLSARNNKSCRVNIDFARAEIKKQVSMGVLSEVPWKPYIVNPISCVFSNKWRLVVDCRLLNPFVQKRKIKLEDLSILPNLVSQGDYMSTDDLEKGYWQVKLNPLHRKYIGVSLDGKYYVANVLILGITDAVFCFTKLVRPIVRYLRARGVPAAAYIDDFFTSSQPFALAHKNRNFLLFVLTKCGWLVNIPKHLPILQKKIFLGLLVNSITMEYEIPEAKLDAFLLLLEDIESLSNMPVRLLAKFLGTLNSFSRALGQVVRLMTRALYSCLKPAYTSSKKWNSSTSLTDTAREELSFWKLNIAKLNGFAICPVTPSVTTCEVIAGDASGEGLYAARFSDKNETVFSRKLTANEKKESSTYRECLVIFGIYTNPNSPIHSFKGHQILHLTDNRGVVSVFQIGSPKKHLQSMAVKVYKAANRLNLKLHFEWKSREDPTMRLVDMGSRGPWPDFDDFSLDCDTVREVKSRNINLDGFASYNNCVVDRHISAGFQIEAVGTNFFTMKFTRSDVVLIHPHPCMLFNALRHICQFNCRAVVVMHLWAGYPPYRNFLLGGHLPSFCYNIKVVKIDFKANSPAPAFTGVRNFSSCIFNVDFTGTESLLTLLQSEGSRQGDCLLGGCHICDKSLSVRS